MIPNTIDFPEILEAFKHSLHADDASSNTMSAYLSDLAHFVSWYTQTISEFRIDEITPTDIRAYREFLQEQVPPTTPATINRRLAALRRFFMWAKENHLTEFQPTGRIHNVEIVSHGPKSLDRKQWHRLQRSVEQAKGIQGIRDYLQVRSSVAMQHLLVGQRGEPLSAHAIYDVVVKYGRLAGLDEVTPHTLRHTFARALLMAGTQLTDIADLLGHSSLDTTRIYTRASDIDLAFAVGRLETL